MRNAKGCLFWISLPLLAFGVGLLLWQGIHSPTEPNWAFVGVGMVSVFTCIFIIHKILE